jgi:GTP-binding protein
MLATLLESDLPRPHADRPVEQGTCKPNIADQGAAPRRRAGRAGRITKLLAFRGLERVPVEEAEAGDIIAIAGLKTPPSPTRCATPPSTEPAAGPARSIRRRWP